MTNPRGALRRAVTRTRDRLSALTGESERTTLLGAILLGSAVSAAIGFVLTQYYSVDVLSSLIFFPDDCWANWPAKIGRHCFGDYAMLAGSGMRPNPWDSYPMLPPHQPLAVGGPAAGMLLPVLFALPAKWLGAPQSGLIAYVLALTVAVLTPAFWASRGARGLERVVIFIALGAAAIPAWMVIDRGNTAGFMAVIGLVFFVGLCRRRWGLVAVMVVLAALVKPQFAVLVVALFAARQWRWGVGALAGVALTNIAAYLLWPRDFPATIAQSLHNTFSISSSFSMLIDARNVAFSRALLLVPDSAKLSQTGGKMPEGFLAGPRSLLGYAVLLLAVICVLALGRRIPPVMVGIVLLATATLAPPLALFYHLVFVLPIAALIVRDPNGPPGTGILDRLGDGGRRAMSVCLTLAVALTIVQIALPGTIGNVEIAGQPGTHQFVATTTFLTPFLWLIACAAIIVSYARRPASSPGVEDGPAREGSTDTAVGSGSPMPELMAESSPRAQA